MCVIRSSHFFVSFSQFFCFSRLSSYFQHFLRFIFLPFPSLYPSTLSMATFFSSLLSPFHLLPNLFYLSLVSRQCPCYFVLFGFLSLSSFGSLRFKCQRVLCFFPPLTLSPSFSIPFYLSHFCKSSLQFATVSPIAKLIVMIFEFIESFRYFFLFL